MKPDIIKTYSFVGTAAELIVAKLSETIEAHGQCVLGLCGGRTPEPVYTKISERGNDLDWGRIIVTFSDERCVSPDHAESNFRMARESLLSRVPLPPENIYRMQGELAPEEAASAYEKRLLQLPGVVDEVVNHDLLLLGIGDDGHTASLFPGTEALSETERLVVANYVPKFENYRLTYTYKTINASRHVCFLVNDSRKERVITEILEGNTAYPAARVTATESLTWILGS